MKQKFKIVLDIIMLIMVITFFNKNLISLKYHEIAGLILIAIMILHIALNVKVIISMYKKFKKVPAEIKAGFIIDILLIMCFLWIGISGIFISRTILTGISSNNAIFKLGHMFAGGLSVILLGIHIGLHVYRKPLHGITAIVISAVVLCGGIYGVIKSSEIRWLTIPFTAITQSDTESHGNEAKPPRLDENEGDKTVQDQNDQQGRTDNNIQRDRKNIQTLSFTQRLGNVLMFLSMILLCTMIVYWIVIFKNKIKKNKVKKI